MPAEASPEPSAVPARRSAVEAVRLRAEGVDAAGLLEALQLRSPQRALAIPPWPSDPQQRHALFAVATVRQRDAAIDVTLVLSDGRAYYRTLEATPDDAPRVAASTIANLLAAIEEDEVAPDEHDVPLPAESEPAPEVETPPEPEVPVVVVDDAPPPESPPAIPVRPPFELEAIAAGTVGAAVGPPAPSGFAGGGGTAALELRWPRGPLLSLAVRSHWHRPDPLTVGRTRVSIGGGHAWRRGRFELRTVAAIDLEPWGVRRSGVREAVIDPRGRSHPRGLQLGGHLRVVPSWRVPISSRVVLRVGPRLELAGSGLAQTPGVARLLVLEADGRRVAITRVGGLELWGGLELGLAWALRRRRA